MGVGLCHGRSNWCVVVFRQRPSRRVWYPSGRRVGARTARGWCRRRGCRNGRGRCRRRRRLGLRPSPLGWRLHRGRPHAQRLAGDYFRARAARSRGGRVMDARGPGGASRCRAGAALRVSSARRNRVPCARIRASNSAVTTPSQSNKASACLRRQATEGLAFHFHSKGTPMKIAALIARILLGLVFTFFGLNGFLNFLPQPPFPPRPAAQFVTPLFASHYLYLIAGVQVITAFLLPINRSVPLP